MATTTIAGVLNIFPLLQDWEGKLGAMSNQPLRVSLSGEDIGIALWGAAPDYLHDVVARVSYSQFSDSTSKWQINRLVLHGNDSFNNELRFTIDCSFSFTTKKWTVLIRREALNAPVAATPSPLPDMDSGAARVKAAALRMAGVLPAQDG